MQNEIKSKLKQYSFLVKKQKELKKEVDALKGEILTGCFNKQSPDTEGTQKVELGDVIVKAAFKLSRKVVAKPEEHEQIFTTLGSNIYDRLFKQSFSLSVTEYKRLTNEERAFVDNFLEIKLAAPTLSVEGDFSE